MKFKVRASLFSYVQDVIDGKKRRPFLKALLVLLSYGFQAGVKFKNGLYDCKIIASKKAPLKVVSIGNITAGGTGKTPFTLLLANELGDEKIAILCRGYRSFGQRRNTLVCGKCSVAETGDEPMLLFKRLKEVPIYTGKDRYRSAVLAKERGAKIVLLDDGFQHRKLFQDVKIVLLDSQDLWGKGHFLPAGYLRENPTRLRGADFIILNRVPDEVQTSILKKEIARYSSSPVLAMRYKPGCIRDLQQRRISLKRGTKAGIFCAIAKPESFEKTMNLMRISTVHRLFQFDHESIDMDRLQQFACSAKEKGACSLFCTEKDMVKLPENLSLCLPVYYLEMELEFVSPEEEWQMLIRSITGIGLRRSSKKG